MRTCVQNIAKIFKKGSENRQMMSKGRNKKSILSIIITLVLVFAMILPDGYVPAYASEESGAVIQTYGKDTGEDSITLYVDDDGMEHTYQWQYSDTKEGIYTDLDTEMYASAQSRELTGLVPTQENWYKCKIDENTYSLPVMAFKNGTTDAELAVEEDNTYAKSLWYISNGSIAYTFSIGIFDILGRYSNAYDGQDYWIGTSYDSNWGIASDTQAEPMADSEYYQNLLSDAKFSFSQSNAHYILVEVVLGNEQHAMTVGADIMLANANITTYSDFASLNAVVEDGVLQQIQLVGAASPDSASATDPAFVFRPVITTPAPSCFYIGECVEDAMYGYAYGYNVPDSNMPEFSNYTTTEIDSQQVATGISGLDSVMTVSWMNLGDNAKVSFEFGIGGAADIGVVDTNGATVGSGNNDEGNGDGAGAEPGAESGSDIFYKTYGKNMGSTITLYIEDEGEHTYQWQVADTKDGEYNDLTDPVNIENTFTEKEITFTPTSEKWYRCKIGEEYSKPVMVIKGDTSDAQHIDRSNSKDLWYVSNDTMAYYVNGNTFDIRGKYSKNSKTYWMNTSYRQTWSIGAHKENEPAPSTSFPNGFSNIKLSFDEEESRIVLIEATVAADYHAVAIGTDTMLGDGNTSGSYSDAASLKAIIENKKLLQVQIVGAKSLKEAVDTDPAFVFRPVTAPDYFWIGAYGHSGSGEAYTYNYGSESYNTNYVFSRLNGEKIVTEVIGADSSMAVSWTNIPEGGTIAFQFSIGSVKDTGAITRSIVTSTSITVEDASENFYYALFSGDGETMVRPWTNAVDDEKRITFSGLNPDTDYIVKNVPASAFDGNPENPEQAPDQAKGEHIKTALSPFTGSGASNPQSLVSATENTITVRNLNPDYIYSLSTTDGAPVDTLEPNASRTVKFTNLKPGTTYLLTAASEENSESDAIEVRTLDGIVINYKSSDCMAVIGEEQMSTISINAESTNGNEVSYTWYRNTRKSSQGAQRVEGTGNTYTIPSDAAIGNYYYYAVLTAPGVSKKTSDFIMVSVRKSVTLSGTVTQNGNPVEGAKCKLTYNVIAEGSNSERTANAVTDGDGNYEFTNILNGMANLVVVKEGDDPESDFDDIGVTMPVNLTDDINVQNVVLPTGNTNTDIEKSTNVVSSVSADLNALLEIEPEAELENDMGITEEDLQVVTDGGRLTIKLDVDDTYDKGYDVSDYREQIIETSNINADEYDFKDVDISVTKTVQTSAVAAPDITTMKELNDLIEVALELPATLRSENLRVFRVHESVLEELTKTPNEFGEYFKLSNDCTRLTLVIKRFSLFTFVKPKVEIISDALESGNTPLIIPAYDISVDITSAEMEVDDELQIHAVVVPLTPENKDLIYESSDESVAIVSEDGLITAVGAGSATITIKSVGGIYKEVKITVSEKQDEEETTEATEEEIEEDLARTYTYKEARKILKSLEDYCFHRLRLGVSKTKKDKLTLKWKEESEADGYMIFGNMCNHDGEKHKMELIETVPAKVHKLTISDLKEDTYYKFRVVAYKLVDGERVAISKTPVIHMPTKGKHGTEKAVLIEKVGKKVYNQEDGISITLAKGKKRMVTASIVTDGKPIDQHRGLVYESTDENIVSVTADGQLQAVGAGECTIYIYAQNGTYNTIDVTVR